MNFRRAIPIAILVVVLLSLMIVSGTAAYYGIGARQVGVSHPGPCNPSLRDSAPCGPDITGGGTALGK